MMNPFFFLRIWRFDTRPLVLLGGLVEASSLVQKAAAFLDDDDGKSGSGSMIKMMKGFGFGKKKKGLAKTAEVATPKEMEPLMDRAWNDRNRAEPYVYYHVFLHICPHPFFPLCFSRIIAYDITVFFAHRPRRLIFDPIGRRAAKFPPPSSSASRCCGS